PGTPAARMPQVDGRAIKRRAKALREAGAAATRAYLEGQVGARRSVLLESPRMGRTEHFAQIRFGSDQPVGEIVSATVSACEDGSLIAG
ncbi:MAG: tRNA (N(6)-L-threonylcarbamoyladenosine(37)-C(2))-methylthiotransferase MtaB, partial [Pseudomonadota bacterium]